MLGDGYVVAQWPWYCCEKRLQWLLACSMIVFFAKQDKLRLCNVLTIANLEFFFDVHLLDLFKGEELLYCWCLCKTIIWCDISLTHLSVMQYLLKNLLAQECSDLTVVMTI